MFEEKNTQSSPFIDSQLKHELNKDTVNNNYDIYNHNSLRESIWESLVYNI